MSDLIFIGSWLLVGLIIALSFWFSRYIGYALSLPVRRLIKSDDRVDAVVLVVRVLLVYVISQYAISMLALHADTLVILIAAAVTAVISLSMQTAAGNLINGVVLRSRSIFHIGDNVNIGGSLRGKVTGYDFFALWLISADNEAISVPWTTIIEQVVINESMIGLRPIECPVPIAEEMNIAEALETLQGIADNFQLQEKARWTPELQKKVAALPVIYPYVVYRSMAIGGEEGEERTAYVYALVNTYDDRLLDQARSKLLVSIDLGLQDG